ncbi:hypothetical protein BCV72DRAFT_237414, partial [Rhizopus microsporus var. microsporus]
MKIRDTLPQNSDFYINAFLDYILCDNPKNSVCYAIEEEIGNKEINWSKVYICFQQKVIVSAPFSCWFFAPGCAHLSADTFRRPIAVYPENELVSSPPELFFLLLRIDKYYCTIEGFGTNFTSPVILQRVEYNHFITFNFKKHKKMLWTRPHLSMWEYACNKTGKVGSYKRS